MTERVWLVAASMVLSGAIAGAQERLDTDMNRRARPAAAEWGDGAPRAAAGGSGRSPV